MGCHHLIPASLPPSWPSIAPCAGTPDEVPHAKKPRRSRWPRPRACRRSWPARARAIPRTSTCWSPSPARCTGSRSSVMPGPTVQPGGRADRPGGGRPAWRGTIELRARRRPEAFAKLEFRDASAGISQTQRDNREGWWSHAQKNRAFIEGVARQTTGGTPGGGAGSGRAWVDLPLVASWRGVQIDQCWWTSTPRRWRRRCRACSRIRRCARGSSSGSWT